MKTILKAFLTPLCCLSLMVTDAMALGGNGGKGGKGGGKSASRSSPSSRPSVRPSGGKSGSSRNPMTGSKVSRPSTNKVSRPTSKPASRPAQKPAARPESKPAAKPVAKPAGRPEARPGTKPATLPSGKPDARPQGKPSTLPGKNPEGKPSTLPGSRPNGKPSTLPGSKPANRPTNPNKPAARPETKPGNVTYPKPNQRPTTLPGKLPGGGNNKPGAGGNNRPGGGNNNPGMGGNNRPSKPVVKPGQNTRPPKGPNLDASKNNNIGNKVNVGNKQTNNNWWNSNKTTNNRVTNNRIHNGNNNIKIDNSKNVTVNKNFKNSRNWSTNQKNWGYNPWWNRPATRPWYGGSWNCGWNNNYYRHHNYHHGYYYGGYRVPGYAYYDDDNDVLQAVGWGLVGWSLGSMIYNSGYKTYSNPYPAPPVQDSKGGQVTYNQPITVVAAEKAPAEQAVVDTITETSENYIVDSQDAFKAKNYLVALDNANKAVAEAPGDGALHEYRSLVLFALGKYSEAAGVLNPVLAGGPGWDWTTMVTLYDSQETYLGQLKGLEAYSAAKPDAADARFLLGYHYMVCGHIEDANAQFAAAARLQPADSVSAQLRDLTAASSNSGDAEPVEPAESEALPPAPEPVPLEKLTGTWVSDKGAEGTVTLAFKDDGKFIWTFAKDGKSNEFGGDFSMNDDGSLVLDAEDAQMVANVELPVDNQMKFVLSGGPPGDPGMAFEKK